MKKNILFIPAFTLLITVLSIHISEAKGTGRTSSPVNIQTNKHLPKLEDTVPPPEIIDIVKVVITSSHTFNIDAVANLYTPNAVIADDEAPYSWNGPTAGIQWVNSIEQVCKDNHLTKFNGSIGSINVYQHSADNAYIVVPVNYTGVLRGNESFMAEGAFIFVLRLTNGKWLIKSQAWMPSKGL